VAVLVLSRRAVGRSARFKRKKSLLPSVRGSVASGCAFATLGDVAGSPLEQVRTVRRLN
jgi:hypothetical protein